MSTSDMFSVSHSLAAAIQDTVRAQCAWCGIEYAPPFGCGAFCTVACRDAEMAEGSGTALRSAHQVEQDRRKSSIALCGTCSHTEKAHGSHSGSCLQKIGGRFDGATDQSRCRCTKFVAAEQPDTLADDLLASLVLAQGKAIARLKEQVSGLLARETV